MSNSDLPVVLAIDDEQNVLYALEKGLRSEPFELRTAATAREALDQIAEAAPDVILCDIRLPDLSGLELFDRMQSNDHRIPIIFMTAHGTAETAIEAMKRGAFDYLLKPYDLGELKQTIQQALDSSRLRRVPVMMADEVSDGDRVDRIVGNSPAMQTVYKEIGRVAPRDVNVLVLGESGTGKELVARAIFRHSLRREQPFLALNCAALPDSLLESELFGHEKGAFTGADRRRIGKFEQADGGTLFLDEIGDMSLATQAKVLRVLQDGTFERVGSNQTLKTDVRMIAATNRDLESRIAEQSFRQDLFYRLNTFTLKLPPLRDRLEDLPALVEHFVRQNAAALNKPVAGVAEETMQALKSYTWPGNVRELQSAIKYAIVRTASEVLTPDSLPEELHRRSTAGSMQLVGASERTSDEAIRGLVRSLVTRLPGEVQERLYEHIDRVMLEESLAATDGNQAKAAALLGISRTTLRARLQALGMTVSKTTKIDLDRSDHLDEE